MDQNSPSAARVAAAFISRSSASPARDAKLERGGPRVASEGKCVVCGEPGEVIRFFVRGADRTELAGRVFPKTSILCPRHASMCEGV